MCVFVCVFSMQREKIKKSKSHKLGDMAMKVIRAKGKCNLFNWKTNKYFQTTSNVNLLCFLNFEE